MSKFNKKKATEYVESIWEGSAIEALSEYIKVPNKSPAFVDKDDAKEQEDERKYNQKAANILANWAKGLGFDVKVITEKVGNKELTPIILGVVESNKPTGAATVLLYGHFDKQPPFGDEWGPYKPKREGDKLYGRGSVDDGHAIFTAFTAISYLTKNNLPHDRFVVFIEGSEESGSVDLPTYLEKYSDVIGDPSLIISLDSGCVTYDRLWITNSLRGSVTGYLSVHIMEDGRHSGQALGIVPSTFRIQRQLLERIENGETGEMLPSLNVPIPPKVREDIGKLAKVLGGGILADFPFVKHPNGTSAQPVTNDIEQLLLNMTWKTFLAITGQAGIPSLEGGNVLRPFTDLKLALRTAPTLDPYTCIDILKETLEKDPPYNAKVEFKPNKPSYGWASKELSPLLAQAAKDASEKIFGEPPSSIGMGGSVPFIGVLSAIYEDAEILVTGAQGPGSNAHVQYECLDIAFVKKLTTSLAYILFTLAKGSYTKTQKARRFAKARELVKAPASDFACCLGYGYVYDALKQHKH